MSGGILPPGLLGGLLGGAQPQGTGILGNMNTAMTDNASTLLGLGAGLLSGNWGAAMQGAQQGMQADQRTRLIKQEQAERERQRLAAQQLAQKLGTPELADMPEVLSSVAASRYKPKEYGIEETYLRNLQQTDPGRFKQIMDSKVGGGSGNFGLNPVYGTDAEGNPVILQMNSRGGAAPVPLPPGVKLAKEPIKMDAGTHFVLLDPITRQTVGTIPKDNAGAARDTALGKAQGDAIANLPGATQEGMQALNVIEKLRSHPGREFGTGMSGALPTIPGTQARDFRVLLNQAQGQVFLQAYQSLKGGGQITEVEGRKAEEAIARLNRTQTEEGFLEALSDLESVIKAGMSRAAQRAGQGGAPAAPAAPQRRRYNPQTGELE